MSRDARLVSSRVFLQVLPVPVLGVHEGAGDHPEAADDLVMFTANLPTDTVTANK